MEPSHARRSVALCLPGIGAATYLISANLPRTSPYVALLPVLITGILVAFILHRIEAPA